MAGTDPHRLPVPEALLLDFGGVIMLTSKPDGGREAVARAVTARLARAGHDLTAREVEQSLRAGSTALKHWKHASSRRRAPREMTHREVVGDFLASDLPDGPREVLVSEADWLLDLIATTVSGHEVRPGIVDLLAAARERGVPVGIVSNAHSGRSHRALLDARGLADAFAVQVYSDEVGVRKPNPAIMAIATEALGVSAARCWYVGDTLDRDVVAARRAGIGTVLLTRSQHTDSPPFAVRERADAIYEDPVGLLDAFLAAAAAGPAAAGPQHTAPGARCTSGGRARAAFLVDHGGVLSTSSHAQDALHATAERLARLLHSPAEPLDTTSAEVLLADARAEAKGLKRATMAEVDPRTFWVELVGRHLSARQRALLSTEAQQLTYHLGLTKSRRRLREGVKDLLRACRELDMPVVVVSNTISGRSVRALCESHGIDDLIATYVCSDEAGTRKPDPELAARALRAVGGDPARSWFLGDKPENDAACATAAGIAHRVLVRGGSTEEVELQIALGRGLATAVVDHPGDVLLLLPRALTPTA